VWEGGKVAREGPESLLSLRFFVFLFTFLLFLSAPLII